MNLAEALKKYREKRGVTQEQMGRLLGVSDVSVWKWENGRSRPNQKIVLDRIKRLVGRVTI